MDKWEKDETVKSKGRMDNRQNGNKRENGQKGEMLTAVALVQPACA